MYWYPPEFECGVSTMCHLKDQIISTPITGYGSLCSDDHSSFGSICPTRYITPHSSVLKRCVPPLRDERKEVRGVLDGYILRV